MQLSCDEYILIIRSLFVELAQMSQISHPWISDVFLKGKLPAINIIFLNYFFLNLKKRKIYF